jgi:hypothetical protein
MPTVISVNFAEGLGFDLDQRQRFQGEGVMPSESMHEQNILSGKQSAPHVGGDSLMPMHPQFLQKN